MNTSYIGSDRQSANNGHGAHHPGSRRQLSAAVSLSAPAVVTGRHALLAIIALLPTLAFAQVQPPLVAGANVNMVSGTEFPGGDPFLQRQNEPSLAVSTRNPLHLLGGANDYRTVDIPGLPDGKAVGDSWPGVFASINGGGSWVSTLIPGFPQDQSAAGGLSPLKGYDAGADPVIRAGTNGLFYYSGIVFSRGAGGKSAAFVSRFMDLNNNPLVPDSFEDSPIRYIDTIVVDADAGETYDADGNVVGEPSKGFIDKPWIAVDIPRGATTTTLSVPQGSGFVNQTIACGNVYMAYAQITGEDTSDIDSHIKFSRSTDCGESFSDPIEIDDRVPGVADRSINQGTSVAVDPRNGDVYVAWRQFHSLSLNCTRGGDFWEQNPAAWPVERFMVGGVLYSKAQALGIMAGQQNGNPWRLARELIVAKLNIIAGAKDAAVVDTIDAADAWLVAAGWAYDGGGNTKTNTNNGKGNGKDNDKEKTNSSAAADFTTYLEAFNAGELGVVNCDEIADSNGQLPPDLPDAIMVVKSTDGGVSFSAPVEVSTLIPFDQGTTRYTFRANSYPTMTVDDVGTVYLAWSTRGRPHEPEYVDSRIVVSTSSDGSSWTTPHPIDEDFSSPIRGHQIQPTITFTRGKLVLVYLDFRQDRSNIFERFIADVPTDPPTYRHTVDVRAAQADPSATPIFTDYSVLKSTQLSRYFNVMLKWDETAPAVREQLQYNPLNQPLFKGGTVPFIGDYIDVAASASFIPDGAGGWDYDLAPGDSPVFHAVWSDNRDVRGPVDGDWTNYVPPSNPYSSGGTSLFDSSKSVEACEPGDEDRTGMRNQNIYTSRVGHGLYVAIPNNSKPLNPETQRSFVVYVKYSNNTLTASSPLEKQFTLSLANADSDTEASFVQFPADGVPVTRKTVTIGNNSSTSVTVFVTSSNPMARVDVLVNEVAGGLSGSAKINPDPSNPPPLFDSERYNPGEGDSASLFRSDIFGTESVFENAENGTMFLEYDPDQPSLFDLGKLDPDTLTENQLAFLSQALVQLSLSNPDVFNPGIYNPGIYNPGIYNPGIYNPGIYNPGIYNPGIYNPGIYNPGIYNPGIYNPGIYNPGIYNGTITDVNYTITNDGDTTSAYDVNLRLDQDAANADAYTYQLIISRIYTTPVADGCNLIEAPVQEILVNNIDPDMYGNLLDTESPNSFYLEPGEIAIVTIRAIPKGENPPGPPPIKNELSISVIPDGVNESDVANGETVPSGATAQSPELAANPLVITTGAVLPGGTFGVSYPAVQLSATGGSGVRVWSARSGLPAGLVLNATGVLSGMPLVGSLTPYVFVARVVDATGVFDKAFTIEIAPPSDLAVSAVTVEPAQPSALDLITFRATVVNGDEGAASPSSLRFVIGATAADVDVPAIAGNGEVSVAYTLTNPLAAGTYTVAATADATNVLVESNEANNAASEEFTVVAQLAYAGNAALDGGVVGTAYAAELVVSGGTGLRTWTLSAGTLPDGLSLDATGRIGGTPTTAGTSEFTVTVADGTQNLPLPLSITIAAAPGSGTTWSGNSHFYQVVTAPGITWAAASDAALAAGGYLATLTSQEENDFVNELRRQVLGTGTQHTGTEVWIGGFQPQGSVEPLGGWEWANGAGLLSAGYTNWGPGEPNDAGGNEGYLALGLYGANVWNDEGTLSGIGGYVIEYSLPTADYETALELVSPVASVGVSKIVYNWSTEKTSGHIAASDLTQLTMVVFSGGSAVHVDRIIVDGVVQPLISNNGGLFARPASDVFWDYDLATLTLAQFRNASGATLSATSGVFYLVTDNVSLPVDSQIYIGKYSGGSLTGSGIGTLALQSTAVQAP